MNSLGFNKKEKDTKVIVAMSGGVDSSVAAVKLKKEGYDVTGVTLRLYNQPNSSKSKSCCAGIDIADAKKVASRFAFLKFTFLNWAPSNIAPFKSAPEKSALSRFVELKSLFVQSDNLKFVFFKFAFVKSIFINSDFTNLTFCKSAYRKIASFKVEFEIDEFNKLLFINIFPDKSELFKLQFIHIFVLLSCAISSAL